MMIHRYSFTAMAVAVFAAPLFCQTSEPVTKNWTTADDHRNMMEQLGIKALRPGPSGRAAAGDPNAANYDSAKANPYPDLPEVLTLKNGRKVTTREQWARRRAEMSIVMPSMRSALPAGP